jgi:hypothetical protein
VLTFAAIVTGFGRTRSTDIRETECRALSLAFFDSFG